MLLKLAFYYFLKLFIINLLLETSSSNEIEDMLCVIKEERSKIKNYVNIMNEYSDKETYNYI